MTRNPIRTVFPLLLVPMLLLAGCSRPQRTAEEVAGPISPPALRYGAQPPGGVSESPTGDGAGGSGAAGMQFQAGGRLGGSLPLPVVSAPGGDQIVPTGGNRMSPTTDNAAEGDSSGGSSGADTGHPIPPNVPLVPENAPGADTVPAGTPAQGAGQ